MPLTDGLSMSRLRAAAAAFALAFCTATVAGAQTEDFDVDSQQWTGMSRFVSLAEGLGTPLEPHETLDYGRLESDDTLVIVYPTVELDVPSLARFVIDGGRVLLADDFGASDEFLGRLDIDRIRVASETLPHDRFVAENRELPVFEPEGRHPLLTNVGVVVGNHPSVLRHTGGPVVPYDDGGGLVYDMNLGKGKVIVFGDASLLINHMLRVGDNRTLATNALQYLCKSNSDCRPQLYVRDFGQTGSYGGRDGASRSLAEMADRLNEAVAGAQEEVPGQPLLFYLALILAGGLALYLGTVFSLRESRRYSEFIEEAIQEIPAPQSEFEWNVSRFGADRRETNFALPMAILKEIFEEVLEEAYGPWDEESPPSPEALAERIRREHPEAPDGSEGEAFEERVRELLETYRTIPTRHRVFLDSDAYFSDRDLIQLFERTMDLLESLGLEEEYERRTRTLV